jgi:hypothetical protein
MSEMTALQVINWEDARAMECIKPDELREMIAKFEEWCLTQPQTEIPLKHHFSKGVYAREIFIPRGTLVIGKIHKHRNMNVISSGEVSFLSIDGMIRAKAPHTFVASPGVKRVIYAHEDTTWTTIHGTDETDLDKLEDEFIAKSYDEVPALAVAEKKEIEGESWHG